MFPSQMSFHSDFICFIPTETMSQQHVSWWKVSDAESSAWSFTFVVKRTEQRNNHTPTARRSASQFLDDVLKRCCQINQISSSFQEKPDAGGDTWCNHLYTVCAPVWVHFAPWRPSFLPEAWGLESSYVCVCVCVERLGATANVYHITHTCSRTMLPTHYPDSYDEPRRFMQKIVSFLPTPLQLKWILSLFTSSSHPRYPACCALFHPPRLHPFGVSSLSPLLPPTLSSLLSLNCGCALHSERPKEPREGGKMTL